MDLTIENILLIGSLLLFVSIIAGKASFRFGVPTLILFLAIGMIAGADGLGLYFDDPHVAQLIGIVSLNFILFSGGLDTDWKAVKPILWQGITLSSLGVLLTAVTLGVFVWAVTDFTIYEGLPATSLIALINRQGRFIAPGGATVIEPGDVLIVVANNREGLKQVYDSLKVKSPDHI
jgi:potassium/hydrogen antiporter